MRCGNKSACSRTTFGALKAGHRKGFAKKRPGFGPLKGGKKTGKNGGIKGPKTETFGVLGNGGPPKGYWPKRGNPQKGFFWERDLPPAGETVYPTLPPM